jgi:hypothetical protein
MISPCHLLTAQCCANLCNIEKHGGDSPYGTADGKYSWYDYEIELHKKNSIDNAFNYAVVKFDRCIGHEVGYVLCAYKYITHWNYQNYLYRIGY